MLPSLSAISGITLTAKRYVLDQAALWLLAAAATLHAGCTCQTPQQHSAATTASTSSPSTLQERQRVAATLVAEMHHMQRLVHELRRRIAAKGTVAVKAPANRLAELARDLATFQATSKGRHWANILARQAASLAQAPPTAERFNHVLATCVSCHREQGAKATFTQTVGPLVPDTK